MVVSLLPFDTFFHSVGSYIKDILPKKAILSLSTYLLKLLFIISGIMINFRDIFRRRVSGDDVIHIVAQVTKEGTFIKHELAPIPCIGGSLHGSLK